MKNTFVKVLSFVMALMMVVGTFSTLAVFAEEHKHTKGEKVNEVPATCLENGYTEYICGDAECGQKWVTDVVFKSADFHSYKTVEAEAATCDQNEKPAAEICEHCKKTADGKDRPEVEGSQLKHVLVGKYVEATCDKAGYFTYSCSVCNKTVAKILEEKKYRADQADELNSCKDVEDKNAPAKNPNHEDSSKLEWVITAPSQTLGVCNDGVAKLQCKECKQFIAGKDMKLPLHNAEFWGADGQNVRWVSLNPNNHACNQWTDAAKACKNCGVVNDETLVRSDVKEHEGTAIADAGYVVTMSNMPVKSSHVDNNGTPNDDKDDFVVVDERYTLAELAEHGFKVGDLLTVNADCTTGGFALSKCSTCGTLFIKTTEKGKHNMNDLANWTWDVAENCTEATVVVKKCAVPGCTYTETVEMVAATAEAHDYKVVDELSPKADCVNNGYTHHVCEGKYWKVTITDKVPSMELVDCPHFYDDAIVDPLGHDWEITATGTCGTDLVLTKVCAECHASETVSPVETPKVHSYVTESFAATCDDVAYTLKYCQYCGDGKDTRLNEGTTKDSANHELPSAKTIAAVVKAWNEGKANWNYVEQNASKDKIVEGWTTGKESTCTTEGELIVVCTACDAIVTVKAPVVDHNYSGKYIVDDYATGTAVKKAVKNGDTYTNANKETVTVTISDKVALAATCQTTGYKNDGEICVFCLAVKTAPTVIEKDPYNHADKSKTFVKNGNTVATCQEPVYDWYNTACCGLAKQYVGSKASDHQWVAIIASTATCYAPGNHNYVVCETCGMKDLGSIDNVDETKVNKWGKYVDGELVTEGVTKIACTCTNDAQRILDQASFNTAIAGPEHTFKTHVSDAGNALRMGFAKATGGAYTTAGLTETCDASGYQKFEMCRVCYNATEKKLVVKYNDVIYDVTDSTSASYKACVAAITIAPHYTKFVKDLAANNGGCGNYGITPAINKMVAKTDDAGKVVYNNGKVVLVEKSGDDKLLYAGSAGKWCTKCYAKDGMMNATAVDAWIDNIGVLVPAAGSTPATWNDGTDLLAAGGTAKNYSWNVVWTYFNPTDAADATDEQKAINAALREYYAKNLAQYDNTTHTYEDKAISGVKKSGGAYVLTDCTKSGYVVKVCSKCSDVQYDVYESTNAKHVYDENSYDYVIAGEGNKNCVNKTEKKAKCENCDVYDVVETIPAYGHYTTKGVEDGEKFVFDLHCDKIAANLSSMCDGCNQTLETILKADKSQIIHDVLFDSKKETCDENGYTIQLCRVCNYDDDKKDFDLEKINEVIDNIKDGEHEVPKNDNGPIYLTKVDPTATTEGKATFKCVKCGEIKEITLPVLAGFDTIATSRFDSINAGGTIKVDVTATAAKFAFNTIRLNVFASETLTLVDAVLADDAKFAAENEGETPNVNVAIDNGVVVIYVENDVEGNKLNAVFEAATNAPVVTLVFTADKYAAGEATVYTTAEKSYYYNVESEEEGSEVPEYTETGLTDPKEEKEDITTIKIKAAGDFNGDGTFGISDMQAFAPALAAAILNPETANMMYDLNGDGKINAADIEGLRNYIANTSSLKAYLAMVGEDIDAVLAATTAPVIVTNAEAWTDAWDKYDAAKAAYDKAWADYKAAKETHEDKVANDPSYTGTAPTEPTVVEPTEPTVAILTVADDASRKVLFDAAIKALVAKLTPDEYLASCKKLGAANLTEWVAAIVKGVTQEAAKGVDLRDRTYMITPDTIIIPDHNANF